MKKYVIGTVLTLCLLAGGIVVSAQTIDEPVEPTLDVVTVEPTPIPKVDDPIFELEMTKTIKVFRGTQKELDNRISDLQNRIILLQSEINTLKNGQKKPL